MGANDDRAPIEPPRSTRVGPRDPTERAAALPRRSKYEVAVLRNDLKKTFVGMGIKPTEAARLVDDAFKQLGPDGEVEALIREALRNYRTG